MPLGHEERERIEQHVARCGRAGGGGASSAARQGSACRRPFAVAHQERGSERLEVRLASQAVGHRLEASCRACQQLRRLTGAPLVEGDLSAQHLDPGAPELVERSGIDRAEQAECAVERTGIAAGMAAASRRVARRDGSGDNVAARPRNAAAAASPPRACARAAERSSSTATASSGAVDAWASATHDGPGRAADRWPPRGRSARPGAPAARPTVDRRAYERVTEHHPLADVQ